MNEPTTEQTTRGPRAITDEAVWTPWLDGLRTFPDDGYRHAVVLAAHPDDETLGASGVLQHLHDRGVTVELVVATDGEAAFPRLSAAERVELGRVRRHELHESLRAQGLPDVAVWWLGLPDSGLAAHRDELADMLTGPLADADMCLVPWPGDPHPDHQAVGEVGLRVAPLTTHRWSYPIWMWHWLRPRDLGVPKSRAFGHPLTTGQQDRKAAGVAAFTSQLEPGPDGSAPILSPAMLRHFARDREVLFREPPRRSAPVERFAELYDGNADPWGVTESWYERRKRAVALACLPTEEYGTVVEPACGLGALTQDLAARARHVIAFDPVAEAVKQTSENTAHLPNVEVRQAALPTGLPDGPLDLAVFSEILYYLDDDDLAETITRTVAALRPGGHVLAVHWLPWAAEAPRDGMDAHRHLLAHPELDALVEHTDEQFVVNVLRRR
ncbi:bifunctional PIG-L family deacetylase/class I SAM-dependent methyltransferase [Actinophytocola sp.]|uniref:bifunctional PIG-L family deacetylase/class I SAM-dependent methyltransferase n=1 Tax=Actinophytocola sp. TaxID=1872138 RepID=UPI002D478DE3|nr:bifunctional PIG-L family deacetylase/class I SAM-dependent methyltransferase [Actinophytocola sp.]HYQ68913.1 bifunctional PIG-L family deacetylase/class I SAM-dependent methyltransferase [Actinophytocola sp.]